MDLETQLREKIRAIYEDAHRQAAPLIMQLVELESMKPPRMFVIPADLAGSLETRKTGSCLRVRPDPGATHWLNPPPGTPASPPPSRLPDTSASDTAD